mmetsp:Transcript_6362/g.9244  ORF Transcript_6362/g.9244 Transcript_6362/m.9244 type:complete len:473 (-) Transcript_6362:50-1468(-)
MMGRRIFISLHHQFRIIATNPTSKIHRDKKAFLNAGDRLHFGTKIGDNFAFALPQSQSNSSSLSFSTTSDTRHSDISESAESWKDDSIINKNQSLLGGRYDSNISSCNIPIGIASRVGTNLHLRNHHPLNTIKIIIENYWQDRQKKRHGLSFATLDNLDPLVLTKECFDSLLIPPDHISRSKSDTYYLDDNTVLRTHTSAHQTKLLRDGFDRFLVTGDVYRRDEIDKSHYPVFHQMEGVKMFADDELSTASKPSDLIALVESDLKEGLEGMARQLFGQEAKMRWVDAYFPFTNPSFELEVYFNGEWLEVLGCGVVHKDIVAASGRGDQPGWAFGLGLERLAMVLFDIPDIRLFWTQDSRFHSQFQSGKIVKFQPYSKYPPCHKDVSFWINKSGDESKFHPNDLNEIVRDVAGDMVEKVELIDKFVHPKSNQTSNCFRISYRSMDKSLTNEEVDELQKRVRKDIVDKLGVELR